MKKYVILVLLFICWRYCAFTQSDTTYKYFSKTGANTTKDSAATYVKFYKLDNMWHGLEYDMKKGNLLSDGNYMQTNLQLRDGSFNNYKDDGKLDYTSEYVEGKLNEKIYYYKSGEKRAMVSYYNNGQVNQKGWDESGKEIKNYVVEKEAIFKGGSEGWLKYLVKNLNAGIAENSGAPPGNYSVQLQFIINKDGVPANVKVISAPAKCKPCAAEAARVIRDGPAWEPAIQNNEPVIYQATQTITFQVADGNKKG